ncbi:proline-rich protein 15 [Corythoichthys intestinalis]|uniref:proline-rich protein 15 n=1 Tax=Corythoichthys intestinalis TaxID=161448 RepID=UPI0025A6817D|nr:proline-rich protein 15 [Corythoichthys intestinalis]XP_061808474.1 proline-rich protein 15-like [Nerophis lumbriciformis]
MTEKAKWWKAFLPKKKAGSSKDSNSPHTYGADFDPFAQDKSKESKSTSDQSVPQQETNNSLFSDETYDDSHMDSLFNEQTCRRNMKVSRSGRFKQKMRGRIAIPFEEKGTENVAPAKDDIR